MKPRILILGGCGFIGRNLVQYIVEEDLAEEVVVVDKVPPQIAWLNDTHKQCFASPKVTFKSANLINSDSCSSAFARDDGEIYQMAVNCACETRGGQTDAVYMEGIYKLGMNCARTAAKMGVCRYIEISTGYVGNSKQVGHREDCDTKEPCTTIAKWKSKIEDELCQVEGLNYTVVRPAIVYGLGDRVGLIALLMVGAIYKHIGETMKLLYSGSVWKNTVHVKDLCRAIWYLLNKEDAKAQTYNVVDSSNSTQGSICDMVGQLFGINHGYWGSLLSSLAKVDFQAVADEVNEKHLVAWAEMCTSSGIQNTPLSPFLDLELLKKKYMHLDGSKLMQAGFNYEFPLISADYLREVVEDYERMNLFPTSYLS